MMMKVDSAREDGEGEGEAEGEEGGREEVDITKMATGREETGEEEEEGEDSLTEEKEVQIRPTQQKCRWTLNV